MTPIPVLYWQSDRTGQVPGLMFAIIGSDAILQHKDGGALFAVHFTKVTPLV